MSKIKFLISANTLQEEVNYVFGLMMRMKRFNKFGYNLSLPDTQKMNELSKKALDLGIVESDRSIIYTELLKVCNIEDYQSHLENVQACNDELKEAFKIYEEFERNWGFKVFHEYNIKITQFGPGGSYCNNSGKIVMKWNKCIQEPLKVILHEIFHIGIEDSIIEEYNVQHDIKERIVDSFLEVNMKKFIPKHKMQEIGNKVIDQYLKEEDSWTNLNKYIQKFNDDMKEGKVKYGED